MSLGFDLTLLLSVLNTVLFAWLLASLGAELRAVEIEAASARGGG